MESQRGKEGVLFQRTHFRSSKIAPEICFKRLFLVNSIHNLFGSLTTTWHNSNQLLKPGKSRILYSYLRRGSTGEGGRCQRVVVGLQAAGPNRYRLLNLWDLRHSYHNPTYTCIYIHHTGTNFQKEFPKPTDKITREISTRSQAVTIRL